MAYERVQKTFGQSSSKKKHTPIVPPLNEEPTQAGSQLSPLVKPSRIPSSEERDAIKRKIFDSIRRTGENQAMREGLFSETVPVQKAPASSSVGGTPIQAKLTIGAPGDKYEQEADRVAAQVVNLLNAPVAQQSHENQEREVLSVEEEELQMKPMVQLQSGADGMTATPEVETSIQQARGGGHSLADNIREPMEQAFGADFSRVKVHTDAQADYLNQSIQARAFTTGQDVFFRQGEYQPLSRGGQELIAHELTHVVQQSGGAVQSQRSKGITQRGVLQRRVENWSIAEVASGAVVYHCTDYASAIHIIENHIQSVTNAWGGGALGSGFYTHRTIDGAMNYVQENRKKVVLKFKVSRNAIGQSVKPSDYASKQGVQDKDNPVTENDFLSNAEDRDEIKWHGGNALTFEGFAIVPETNTFYQDENAMEDALSVKLSDMVR